MKFRSEEPYNIPCSREGKELSSAPQSISLYPNPASDEVTVKCAFLSNGTIKIFDISGKEKINFPVNALEDTVVIPVSQLPAGSYFVSIISSGAVYQKKLLIVR